jgi:hypothetical protein
MVAIGQDLKSLNERLEKLESIMLSRARATER